MMERVLAVVGSIALLTILFTAVQATGGECITVSVQEIKAGNLESPCLDVEELWSVVLVPAIRGFLARQPEYRVIKVMGYNAASDAAAYTRGALCPSPGPNCFLYTIINDREKERIIVRITKW